jgi:hypothetical protein
MQAASEAPPSLALPKNLGAPFMGRLPAISEQSMFAVCHRGPGGSACVCRAPRSPTDIGHVRRRATDVFLAINAVVYALNWMSKDVLMLLGCKVGQSGSRASLWGLRS